MAANAKKKYPDLRYKLIRGLVNYENLQRKAHYLKQAAEWTSKAVVSLEFNFDEIKSVRQATQLVGIGDTIAGKLREISKDKRFPTNRPAPGKFVSAAPALLVALHMLQEAIGRNDMLQVSKTLVPEAQLRTAAKMLTEEDFVDKEGFCQATWRLHVLANRGLIKKRSRDKLPVYELLPPGEALAKQLMASVGLQGASMTHMINGLVPDMPALSAIGTQVDLPDVAYNHLYTNDDDSDGVVLYVDTREWGGDRLGLINLCQRLEASGIRYATCHLATGDYGWSLKSQGRKVELPFLIERKRVDDLAHSFVDGRYVRQKEKMMTWKRKYTALYQEVILYYVVEGAAETYVVRCADGCGGVGRCGNPDIYQIQALIRELNTSSEFTLIQTQDKGATTDFLVAITRDLQMRVRNGDFRDLLGHAETLNLDKNYSKLGAAAKKGGKTAKAAKKEKKEEGAGAYIMDAAVWDGVIPHTSTADQSEVQRRNVQTERSKKQRKRKIKAPIVDINGCIPGAIDPSDGQNQRYQADLDLPISVDGRDFETSWAHVRPSDPWSTGPATSQHYDLEEQKSSIAATGTSDNYSSDAVRSPLEPKCPKTEVPRKRTKARKVHEITWSDDEEDQINPSSTASLSNEDPGNKRWHVNSPGSTSISVPRPMVKTELGAGSPPSSAGNGGHEFPVKTEPGLRDYPTSPIVKQEACVNIKEERWSAELQNILEVLPDTDKDLACRQLDMHAGNVEAVISALIEKEEDLTHLGPTISLSSEDSSTSDKRWHGSSSDSASSSLPNQDRPVVKTEMGGGSPPSPAGNSAHECAFKTERGLSDYPTKPIVKQEASINIKEERWSAELQNILVILPDADKDLARIQLDTLAGNVEAAVSALLDSAPICLY